MIQRAFDVLVAGAALPVVFILFIVIGLLIKATSRGPVLFKQKRMV